jgi:hypothetical protein
VRPLSLSLPRRPHLSAVLNLPPMISPPRTRPRPRVLRPRPCARAPFEPRALLVHLSYLICVVCPTFSPSLSLFPRDHRLFRGRHRARAPSSATVSSVVLSTAQDTLRCALFFLATSDPRSPECFLHSRSPTAIDPRLHRTPAVLQTSRSSHSR